MKRQPAIVRAVVQRMPIGAAIVIGGEAGGTRHACAVPIRSDHQNEAAIPAFISGTAQSIAIIFRPICQSVLTLRRTGAEWTRSGANLRSQRTGSEMERYSHED